jgi:hypothetical protein
MSVPVLVAIIKERRENPFPLHYAIEYVNIRAANNVHNDVITKYIDNYIAKRE